MSRFFILFFALTLSLSSFAKGRIPGVVGPYINIIDEQVLISMGLTEVELPAYGGGIIPRTENSRLSLEPNNEDGGMLVVLKLDIEDIKKALKVQSGDSQLLPCGRPIMGFPTGEMKNGIRLDLGEDKYNISFYFSKTNFGTYVPFKFNLPLREPMAIPLQWKGKQVGSLSLVGRDGDKSAGGAIFIRWAALKANKEFMRLVEKSKNNPGVMY